MTLVLIAAYLILSVLASYEIIHNLKVIPNPTTKTAAILIAIWPIFLGAWMYGFILGMIGKGDKYK